MKLSVVIAVVLASGCLTAATVAVPVPVHTSRAQVRHAAVDKGPQRGRITFTPGQAREAMALEHFNRPVASILDISSPLDYGDYRWDEAGVPPGPIWVRIDLSSQIISVFRGPNEIGTAVILYGARSNRTPLGAFPILAKLRDHRSITYDNAPMPYTLRLTADGVSIHGSNVRDGYATHGCIGVPTGFAAKLFAAASKGDKVYIVDGDSRKKA